MRSVQSVLFEKFLILRGTKKKFMDLHLLDDFIAMKHNEKPYELDAKFRDQYQIKKDELNGIHYYTINEQQTPEKVIYYFHGGAYINDPLIFHWRYLVKLAQKTNFTIVVPIYPKLPKHTHRECFVAIHDLYDRLVLKYDAPFIFMGDSGRRRVGNGVGSGCKAMFEKAAAAYCSTLCLARCTRGRPAL